MTSFSGHSRSELQASAALSLYPQPSHAPVTSCAATAWLCGPQCLMSQHQNMSGAKLSTAPASACQQAGDELRPASSMPVPPGLPAPSADPSTTYQCRLCSYFQHCFFSQLSILRTHVYIQYYHFIIWYYQLHIMNYILTYHSIL